MNADLVLYSVILFLAAGLYFSVFLKLIHDWYILPDFAHGFLVPLFVGYVVWSRLPALRQMALEPSWQGLWLLVPGFAMLLLGVLGSELFLARVSFVLVAAGSIWLLAGAEMLRQLRFPLLVCFLAIPVPQVLFNQITVPLQLVASSIAALLLPLLGVPVLSNGNIIQLPSITLEVAEACSGIRSLVSLCTLAVVYGYLAHRSTFRRWLLLAASIPVAICANALRIVGTGLLVQHSGPAAALGFFHEFSGLLMFLVSLLLLLMVDASFARVRSQAA